MLIRGDVTLLRDKKTIRIAGRPTQHSEFFIDILKICSKFCKDFLGTAHGLDFEIETSDKVSMSISIVGASKEPLMTLKIENTITSRPETIIHLNYNQSFYPIKKEFNEKNKNATKILYLYITEKLSLATASHQPHPIL